MTANTPSIKPIDSIASTPEEKPTPKRFPPLRKIAEDKEEKPKQEEGEALVAPPPTPMALERVESHEKVPATPTISASESVTALFEKMASSLIVMHLTNETHTIVTLDHPAFSESPLFGTQVILKEFASAPKTFNVEILTAPDAISTVQKAEEELLSLFAEGHFNFSIHRLETRLQTEPTSLFVDPDQEGQKERDQNEQEDR